MLASFNYYGPPTGALAVGIVVALAILVALAFSRSAVLGLLLGAASWGLIAYLVFGLGKGDMTGLMQIVYGVLCGIAGAVSGLLAGFAGKWISSARNRHTAAAPEHRPS